MNRPGGGVTEATEKDLDLALENAFKESPEFASWFLRRTKFSDIDAHYHWSRSDHPWGRIALDWTNPETGVQEVVIKESETDVLVVYMNKDGTTYALHIENKKKDGKFEPLQPDMYPYRARQWLGNPKYCSYTDFQTVLVAPKEFYERNKSDADKFDCYVSYEDIAERIPDFRI
jgi:hypothetical protein